MSERRFGEPRTEEERAERHEALTGEETPPERGTRLRGSRSRDQEVFTLLGEHSRTFRLKVTTKVQQLCAKNPKRTGLLAYNNGSATVYILSAQNLTTNDGIPVVASASYADETSCAAKWIVAASGTQDVRVEVNSR